MTTAISQIQDAAEAGSETELAQDRWQVLGFPALIRMRREFDELIGKFFAEMPALWNAEREDARWALHVEDQPDAYLIKAEVPGFDKQDLQVELRGNQLVMQAQRFNKSKDDGEESFTATEFYRAVTIPTHVATSAISAEYDKGILTVTLPKMADGKGCKITVKG